MASKLVIPFLVAMMLLTGVCNTLLTKYQDNQCIRNCDDPDPKNRKMFEQPVLQTLQMFIGEAGCWLVVGAISLYRRYTAGKSPRQNGYRAVDTRDTTDADADEDADDASLTSETALDGGVAVGPKQKVAEDSHEGRGVLRGFRVLLLALPAICDICGTTLMNVGLLMVAASIYQMTRGALVLFVGLFSVVFLQRQLHLFQWVSLVGVVSGVAVVGLAGYIDADNSADADSVTGLVKRMTEDAVLSEAARAVIGVLLIAGAQVFTATQFVLEEWILERSTIEPLKVVGWEGTFGLAATLVGMLVLHLGAGRHDPTSVFNMAEGFRQMFEHKRVLLSSFLIMISIGGFNFFGLSVTRSVSATSRSTIDTCRTLFIWLVSLALGWESFKWLQVLGFALLVYFTFLFNGIVRPPSKCLGAGEEVEELLPEDPIEHI